MQRAFELLATHLRLIKDAPEEVNPLVRRTEDIGKRLEFWMKGGNRLFVYWVERRGRGTFLLGLALNQVILVFVHRARPYDDGVTNLLIARSADFSFPSFHIFWTIPCTLLRNFSRAGRTSGPYSDSN